MSYFSLLAALQNDFTILPKVTPPSQFMMLLSELVAPLSVTQLLLEYFTFDRNRNPILRAHLPSEDRFIKIIELPLDVLKQRCKDHRATINEVC